MGRCFCKHNTRPKVPIINPGLMFVEKAVYAGEGPKNVTVDVNLVSTRKYIIRNYMGIYKVLVLLNERGDPLFLLQNLRSYKINNQ